MQAGSPQLPPFDEPAEQVKGAFIIHPLKQAPERSGSPSTAEATPKSLFMIPR